MAITANSLSTVPVNNNPEKVISSDYFSGLFVCSIYFFTIKIYTDNIEILIYGKVDIVR